jgi:hypothetical protein
MTKRCARCGLEQDVSAFTKCSHHKDSLSSWCRTCTRAKNNTYRSLNKERCLQRWKKWAQSHKDYIKRISHKCRLKRAYGLTPEARRDMYAKQNKTDVVKCVGYRFLTIKLPLTIVT